MSNGEAFRDLYALGEERVGKIDDLLTKGLPASQVVEVIQGEWKVWTDRKAGTVKKMLERYRKGPLRQRIVHQVATATEHIRASTLRARLNALDELNDLVGHQKDRYLKMYEREKPTALLMKQVTEEGRLLKEMLVELGRLQLETGVLARAPKKVTGTITDPNGGVQTFEWTQEQEALFNELNQGDRGYVQIPG